jgi:hypothetical protein
MREREIAALPVSSLSNRSRWQTWLAIPVAATALVGCRASHDLPLVPVSGRITFAGGPCPASGNVTFTPVDVDAGLPRRPGSATFHTDGEFAITTFRDGDGLLPGRYEVSITCFSGLPDPRSPDPWGDVSYVPSDYKPPQLVVAAGSDPIVVSYDVPEKKQKGARS